MIRLIEYSLTSYLSFNLDSNVGSWISWMNMLFLTRLVPVAVLDDSSRTIAVLGSFRAPPQHMVIFLLL